MSERPPMIEEIFDEVLLGCGDLPADAAGWQRVPGRRGRPATDRLEVWLDTKPCRLTHVDALREPSAGPADAMIARRILAERREAAYAALLTLEEARSIRGIRRCTGRHESEVVAAAFLNGLRDILRGSGVTHLVMPTSMHRMYVGSTITLRCVPGWHDYVARKALTYSLDDIRIVPSPHAERDSPRTAYAVDSASALHLVGPVLRSSSKDLAGTPTSIKTYERYQFMLLSRSNARTAPGAPYMSSPGFRIEVEEA